MGRSRIRLALMLASAGILVTAMGWTGGGVSRTSLRHEDDQRPECPHDTVVWLDTNATPHTFSEIPLSGDISGIPEFHDCQRFIGSDGKYGALYAIYAAFHLESLPCGLSRCGYGTGGVVGIPAATILSYGGRYEPLGIENGFNCLYLWDPPNWKAVIIPQYDNPDCRFKRIVEPLPGNAKALAVRPVKPLSYPPFRDREYPPVARWDWDPRAQQQYIGIRCGLAWCEVGGPSSPDPVGTGPMYPPPLTFDPVPGLTAATATTKAVYLVKGWFDAERLAERVETPTGSAAALRVRPSRITGFIVPNPVLGDVQETHLARTWVHVAWAVVDSDYTSVVRLKRGQNKVSLCKGTMGECRVSRDRVANCLENLSNTRWWARIENPGGDVSYHCVIFRSYPSQIDVPGTVRWRWLPDDPTNWIKCPSGCCELH
jgi:hypothetical protein